VRNRAPTVSSRSRHSSTKPERLSALVTRGRRNVVVHARSGDTSADWEEAELFRFDADGKVTDTWGIPKDQELVDEFWAGAMSSTVGS
jgi:hypothetical protein